MTPFDNFTPFYNYYSEAMKSFQEFELSQLTKRQKREVIKDVRREPKIGRNEICPCGCGLKYKNCTNK